MCGAAQDRPEFILLWTKSFYELHIMHLQKENENNLRNLTH
jgi:hypothetical protein